LPASCGLFYAACGPITAYREALKERTREQVPFDWARTQNNLGISLATLGERESDPARLADAARTYQAALIVFRAANATYYIQATEANLQRDTEGNRSTKEQQSGTGRSRVNGHHCFYKAQRGRLICQARSLSAQCPFRQRRDGVTREVRRV
jgi:hypothetical protein